MPKGTSISFAAALSKQLELRGETAASLARILASHGHPISSMVLGRWLRGDSKPSRSTTIAAVHFLEHWFGLLPGELFENLDQAQRTKKARETTPLGKRLDRQWRHLPANFTFLGAEKQSEILAWIDTNILNGETEFNLFQRSISAQPFRLRFTNPFVVNTDGIKIGHGRWIGGRAYTVVGKKTSGDSDAPKELDAEAQNLVFFKTDTFTPLGIKRATTWNEYTATLALQEFGRIFGALTAQPDGSFKGLGLPHSKLTFGLLTFPAIWDWYLKWSYERRGRQFTVSEIASLSRAVSLIKSDTGWLVQRSYLIERVKPIPGLISRGEIKVAKDNWEIHCANCLEELVKRRAEVKKVARSHRRPFELLRPILEAENPLKEYLKIAEEIKRLLPDKARYPRAAASAVRSFLIFRLSVALGFRAKNMRELLICLPGSRPTAENKLERLQRGELRWDERRSVWVAFVPANAFKNNNSSFFNGSPFEMEIPDRGDLYEFLAIYLNEHRSFLLGSKADPGTLFVRGLHINQSCNPEFTQNGFHSEWRNIIRLYGIYNPYTRRGAIAGLLPHGPHSLRHVLATHVLKRTGSIEYASYAIQNAPWTVFEYYGRFLPRDKMRLTAKLLDDVWSESDPDDKPITLMSTPAALFASRLNFAKKGGSGNPYSD